jgi:hypothetical protein
MQQLVFAGKIENLAGWEEINKKIYIE